MLFTLMIAGVIVGTDMNKFDCYDAVHEYGAQLEGESYTLSYDTGAMEMTLFMEHPDTTASCEVTQ